MSPSASRLPVKRKKDTGDRARIDQSILAFGAHEIGKSFARIGAVNDTIDHHMRNMDPLRPEFPCETLRDGAQGGFGGGEVGEGRPRAQGGRRPGKKHSAFAFRQHTAHSFPPDEKTAERILPPKCLEIPGCEIQQRHCGIIADIVDDEFQIVARHGLIKKSNDILFACRVGGDGLSLAASLFDGCCNALQSRFSVSGNEDSKTLLRETVRKLRTETCFRSDTNDQCAACCHGNAPPSSPMGDFHGHCQQSQALPNTRMKLLAGRSSCCLSLMPYLLAACSRSRTSFSPHSGTFAARISLSKAAFDSLV